MPYSIWHFKQKILSFSKVFKLSLKENSLKVQQCKSKRNSSFELKHILGLDSRYLFCFSVLQISPLGKRDNIHLPLLLRIQCIINKGPKYYKWMLRSANCKSLSLAKHKLTQKGRLDIKYYNLIIGCPFLKIPNFCNFDFLKIPKFWFLITFSYCEEGK